MKRHIVYILFVQMLALVGWGLYAKHRFSRLEYVRRQDAGMAYNHGIDSMAAGIRNAGLIRTDDQLRKLSEVQERLQKKEGKSWVGLEDHMALLLLTIPAGVLSVLVVFAILRLRSREDKKASRPGEGRDAG
jgi:hypothetical protein